ncbi:putative defense protein 3 [Carassius auratus]|uniref:Defense protein 3 n=1 Tax=Carassius auratus TaxID=7957 RepID=A0A6P6P3V0_CARAU|nr:putative defense protein 3 [Carassius auratus]XP_052411348.1 putative defense protein 3 [Carassius gibelio]XP_052411356.1 putative defense protein 3 [Carassius gibelio]XP_052411377.1 putative defense protein 3 [Carassius gibelio]
MDAVFFGLVILQVLTSVLSYPSGAPTSACVDMMPRHGGVQPKPNPAPYTIHPSSTTFQTGKPITVVIKGPDYSGVLLEARSGSDSKAIGTWQTPPTNTKFLACSGNQQGAITHANTNIKNNSTVYTWIPPATAKNVIFKATVAQQRTVFWVDVMSSTLTSSKGGTSLDVYSSAERIATPRIVTLLLFVFLSFCSIHGCFIMIQY